MAFCGCPVKSAAKKDAFQRLNMHPDTPRSVSCEHTLAFDCPADDRQERLRGRRATTWHHSVASFPSDACGSGSLFPTVGVSEVVCAQT